MEVGCAAIEAFHRGAFSRKLFWILEIFDASLLISTFPFPSIQGSLNPKNVFYEIFGFFMLRPFFAGVERKRNEECMNRRIFMRYFCTTFEHVKWFSSIYNNK